LSTWVSYLVALLNSREIVVLHTFQRNCPGGYVQGENVLHSVEFIACSMLECVRADLSCVDRCGLIHYSRSKYFSLLNLECDEK